MHTWRPTEVVWCNRATQSTEVNQQQQKKICFDMTLREWFTPIHPKNTAELKQLCKDKWCKISPDSCVGLICSKFVVFLPKGFTYRDVHIVFNKDMKIILCVSFFKQTVCFYYCEITLNFITTLRRNQRFHKHIPATASERSFVK